MSNPFPKVLNWIKSVLAKALAGLFFFMVLLPLHPRGKKFFAATPERSRTSYYVVRRSSIVEPSLTARSWPEGFVVDLEALWTTEGRPAWKALLPWLKPLAFLYRKKTAGNQEVDPNIYAMF
jgi:hypothetical protein